MHDMYFWNVRTCLIVFVLGFAWNHPLAVAVGTNEYVFATDLHRLIMITPANLVENGVAAVIAGSIRKLLFLFSMVYSRIRDVLRLRSSRVCDSS